MWGAAVERPRLRRCRSNLAIIVRSAPATGGATALRVKAGDSRRRVL
jgi:hypothetical protein